MERYLSLFSMAMKWVPDLKHLMRLPDKELLGAYANVYPSAFSQEEARDAPT
jgi:hypothetical protein